MRISSYIIALFVLPFGLMAQSEHSSLLDGTDAYQRGDFENAEESFKKAVETNSSSLKGNFNLGNSLFKRRKYDEAATYFQNAASSTEDDLQKSQALYNLGNARLAEAKEKIEKPEAPTMGKEGQKKLQEAIDAYKNALRHNTKDYDAKNNLAAAYKLLRQQQQKQQQQKQQKQEQKQNKDQNKDNKNQPQNQENKNQNQPQKPEENKPIDNNNPSNGTETKKLNKDEVDRLMEIIEQEDKKVQKKLMERKRAQHKKPEKEW